MEKVIGRGNSIILNIKNTGNTVMIHDHSYNSSYESLILMINSAPENSIVIFTPLKECNELEKKYQNIINLIQEKKIYSILYYPDDLFDEGIHIYKNTNLIDKKFHNHQDIINHVMNILLTDIKSMNRNIFIKGANSLKMINVVQNLMEAIIDL